MDKKYLVASFTPPQIPLAPGSPAARKAVLKGEADGYELSQRFREWEWNCEKTAQRDKTDYSAFLDRLSVFLTRSEGQNAVLSPLSVFHALTAAADLTAGDTQKEILSVLGFRDAAGANAAFDILYRANYAQGYADVRPSALLCFDESVILDREKMLEIASSLLTWVCRGSFSDGDYRKAISDWLKDAAGATLPKQGALPEAGKDTKLEVLTGLCFRDKWKREFDRRKTVRGSFRTPEGNAQAHYMKAACWLDVCLAESYTAVPVGFDGGGSMWFVLPKEGLSPEELLRAGFFSAFGKDLQNPVERDVHMAIPRFEAVSEIDMLENLRALGIQKLFTDASETPFTKVDGNSIKIDSVRHGAGIRIDEQGCEASAYTIMRGVLCGGLPTTPPRLDFVLNRPFLFVLTGKGKLPLFVGVVNRPQA